MNKRCKYNQGFSLIEVMIALLILAVGILGAGAMQTVGLQTTQGAYLRSQAIILAGDIVDRMRANRTAAGSYTGVVDTSSVVVTAIPSCLSEAVGCTPADVATSDISRWASGLLLLPGAVGAVTSAGGNSYVVTINWNENEWSGSARSSALQTVQLSVSI